MNNPIITASGAIPAYACVKVSTTTNTVEVCNASTDIVFNFTTGATTTNGSPVVFQTSDNQLDIVTLRASGVIAIGNLLVPSTAGTVVASSSGQFIAMSAATSGQNLTARRFNAGATANFLAPGSTTNRTLDSKLTDVISVKDYGATGNGSTNDTAAIQAALTANAGKTVYFPQGTYLTNQPLTISANTTLKGDDRKSVIFVQPLNPLTPLGDPGPSTCNNGFLINGDGVVIDGLWIRGSNEARYKVAPLDTTQREEYAAGIRSTNRKNIVITNCVFQEFANGVFFTGGNNYKIIDNFFFGGRQMGAANWIANAHDIFMNGSNAGVQKGFRGIISRNHCFGNGDSAISVGIEAGDADVVISENVCEPFQTDGFSALDNSIAPTLPLTPNGKVDPTDRVTLDNPACNKTRYAIIVSYSQGWKSRVIVSNNIIRNHAHSGIYANNATGDPSPVSGNETLIVGNMVSLCGYGLLYPGDQSLKAGIWLNSNGSKLVSSNAIYDCAVSGIVVTGTVGGDPASIFSSPEIIGNTILRTVVDPITSTLGHGISLNGASVHSVLISSNSIFESAGNAIIADCVAPPTGTVVSGNIEIVSNLIKHTNTKGAIRIFVASGGPDCFVSNNSITGTIVDDANSGANAGIWFNGRVHCTGNLIRTFNRGIQSQFTGRVTDVVCANNSMKDMVFGVCGQAEAGPWLVSNNAFTSITNNLCHAGPFQGTVVRPTQTGPSQVDIVQVTAATPPATGTWVVGDYVKNSTPSSGAAKGWYRVAAGGGTWVSEGNL